MTSSNQRGSTTYVIHGSHPDDLEGAIDFQKRINGNRQGEVVLLEKNSNDTRALLSFYGIVDSRTPQLLIVRENDSLLYHWSGSLPAVEDILYRLRQLGQ